MVHIAYCVVYTRSTYHIIYLHGYNTSIYRYLYLLTNIRVCCVQLRYSNIIPMLWRTYIRFALLINYIYVKTVFIVRDPANNLFNAFSISTYNSLDLISLLVRIVVF